MNHIAKLFFLLLLTLAPAPASEQLVLIVSRDFNTTQAVLTRYEREGKSFKEVGESIPVNLGRNGLAWGIGKPGFTPKPGEPVKHEGDGRAPAGIFSIQKAFGYAPSVMTKMPYIQADSDLICVDDSLSRDYNTILDINESDAPKSFEWMHRDDKLYKIGLVIGHNTKAKKRAGSCIFFHIRKSETAPTAGCSAMKEEDLRTLMEWLDPAKDPEVIQIPRRYCPQAEDLYDGIVCR